MIYSDTPFAVVEWDEADQLVFMEWRGYADGDDYRNTLIAIVELIEQKSASRFLSDSRKAKVVTPEDQKWVDTVWTPRATRAGLRHIALVVPDSVVARMSLDRMGSKYTAKAGEGLMHFTDMNEARAWIRTTPR